jgi:uncharacterized hydrophobic protein (TIGR00271 family)
MIDLELFGESSAMRRIARQIDAVDGVDRVRIVGAARMGHSVVVAHVHPGSVDSLLEELRRHGIDDADVTLTRVDVVGSMAATVEDTSLVWADVLGSASMNAQLLARYVAFMVVAGVIAGYGVVDKNQILIVGAMAVSPDLLPITAIAVALVGRRDRLAARAVSTLALGLAIAAASAALVTAMQDRLDTLPANFTLQGASEALGGLNHVSGETVFVALVAGVAGMLALETRASSGVGVAISVTTIPAAAYLGVAAGVDELSEALGAAGVLGVNVAMMMMGAVGTLTVQRMVSRARAGEHKAVA